MISSLITIVVLHGSLLVSSNAGQLVILKETKVAIQQAGSDGFPVGWYADVCNVSSNANVTIIPSAGTIARTESFTLAPDSHTSLNCIRMVSDGVSNYEVMPGSSPILPGDTSIVPGGGSSGGAGANGLTF